jgi:hypothetical protein
MSLHLFHRLRRCRLLFTLALCAWLMMGSTVWAKADCCAAMGMQGMAAMHAQGQAPQQVPQPPHQHADVCQCACNHMTADLSLPQVVATGSIMPAQGCWQAAVQAAPQPGYAPPLRPPAV